MAALISRTRVRADWKSLLALWVLAWIAGQAAGALVAGGDLPPWAKIPFGILADAASWAFAVLTLLGGAYLVFVLVRWLIPSLGGLVKIEVDKEAETKLPPEAPRVTSLVAQVGRRLDVIEACQGNAADELRDVGELAGTLVNLIAGLMRKRQAMVVEAGALEEALAALSSGDSLAIARAAGKVPDDLIRRLMLEVNHEVPEYRLRLAEMVAMHSGDLAAGAEQLKGLALDWMSKVSAYRSRAARLGTAIAVVDAVRPLALLDAHLQMAQYHLSLADESDAQRLLRSSPAEPLGLLES